MPGKIVVSTAGADFMPMSASTSYEQAVINRDYQKLHVSFCGFKMIKSVPFELHLEHTQNETLTFDYPTGFRIETDQLRDCKLYCKLSGDTIKKVYDNLGESIKKRLEQDPSYRPYFMGGRTDPYATSVKVQLHQHHQILDWFNCDRHVVKIWAQ